VKRIQNARLIANADHTIVLRGQLVHTKDKSYQEHVVTVAHLIQPKQKKRHARKNLRMIDVFMIVFTPVLPKDVE
jgi:hypothetical protein